MGDYNGDGKADLAVANFFANTVSVLLGNGDGSLQTQQTFATGAAPSSVAVGDFNGDGKADIAVANRDSDTVSVLTAKGYTINEGSPLTLSASASDPSGNTAQLRYSWDINGDGVFGDATGANPTLTWAQLNGLGITRGPASFHVSVRVTDTNGSGLAVTSAPAPLTIANLPPTDVTAV